MTTDVLYTIGHSTRTLDELGGLLETFAIQYLIDVRTVRRSRRNPQFNEDAVAGPLAEKSITYRAMPALGGLRPRSKTPGANVGWKVQSFENFADYALTEAFSRAFEELWELAHQHRCAIMCAEAVWWRCHRRIITDWYLARGGEVLHIMGPGKAEPATLTSFARVGEDGKVRYPADAARSDEV